MPGCRSPLSPPSCPSYPGKIRVSETSLLRQDTAGGISDTCAHIFPPVPVPALLSEPPLPVFPPLPVPSGKPRSPPLPEWQHRNPAQTSRQTRRHSTYVFIFMSRRERLHQWTKYHHRWWNDQKDDLFKMCIRDRRGNGQIPVQRVSQNTP